MRIAVFYSAFANNRTLAALLTQAQITLFSSTSYGGRYFLEQHLQWAALRIPIGTTIIQMSFPGGRPSWQGAGTSSQRIGQAAFANLPPVKQRAKNLSEGGSLWILT